MVPGPGPELVPPLIDGVGIETVRETVAGLTLLLAPALTVGVAIATVREMLLGEIVTPAPGAAPVILTVLAMVAGVAPALAAWV
jgi:hypothetical protein